MIRVADYIMKRITEEDVSHIFYVPGGQCVYLTDALRRNERLQGISVHHEQTAAMAALSYAQCNNNLGACLVTTGCAGTNTMTGLLHAWQDSIPCIFISGQQSLNNTIGVAGPGLRQIGVQEADIVELVSPITKYAVMLDNTDDIAWHIDRAIYEATHGRKGPVWIDVPLDIQNSMINEASQKRFLAEYEKSIVNRDDVEYVEKLLRKAKRPVILAGQGMYWSNAKDDLQTFVEKWNIPVVFTRFSNDLLPTSYELNMGVIGSFGANRYANFTVQNSDLLISIGSRLSVDTTGPQREQFAREATIVVVDIDEEEHKKKGVRIDHFIKSDAKDFIINMNKCAVNNDWNLWVEKCKHWREVFPNYAQQSEEKYPFDLKYALNRISDYFSDNTTIISDAGMTAVAVPANCNIKDGMRSIHSFAQGEMGFSLPGAIGAACANDNHMIVAFTGDGSFMMNLQELQTLKRNWFNIKIVIMNNNGYSGVRHGQKAHFRGKSIGTDSSNGVDFPNYKKIAEAFGIPYYIIDSMQNLDSSLQQVFGDEQPCICEVICDQEQFDLHNGLVKYGKKKFGFRPIEDQSPWLDRETFFAEMIIEPDETSFGEPV